MGQHVSWDFVPRPAAILVLWLRGAVLPAVVDHAKAAFVLVAILLRVSAFVALLLPVIVLKSWGWQDVVGGRLLVLLAPPRRSSFAPTRW